MKMRVLAALVAIIILALTGCGGHDHDTTPVFVTEILSDSTSDGDIKRDFSTGALTITQGNTESVFAGIDPISGDEYRAFLHFPFTTLPASAFIESAFVEIFINSIDIQFPADTIPVRIDLVSFQPPFLIESDFDFPVQLAPPTSVPIFLTDLRDYVAIDVTPLMIAAQDLQLADFQIRIMEDFGSVPRGLIEINDTTNLANRSTFAPLLTITYF
jgi:hypothetical protein